MSPVPIEVFTFNAVLEVTPDGEYKFDGKKFNTKKIMYWTLELASYLSDAPWPATKDELIDYAIRTGAPLEVVENLQEIEDAEENFDSILEIWPDYPSEEDYLWNEDEY